MVLLGVLDESALTELGEYFPASGFVVANGYPTCSYSGGDNIKVQHKKSIGEVSAPLWDLW